MKLNKVNEFRDLHKADKPLVIANVWDVASALAAEKCGFDAIGTSSAAIANALGYKDGEEIPFEELLFVVTRIAKNTHLPFSVDLESGYSKDPEVTVSYIRQLSEIGVVGINIEDSQVSGCRCIKDAETFARYLTEITCGLNEQNLEIFVNVRTDTFLLGLDDAREETLRRASLYQAAGADGLFVPCITNLKDIEIVANSASLPVNVMCMPELPHFDELQACGIKRISMGNFLFDKLQNELTATFKTLTETGSFAPVFCK